MIDDDECISLYGDLQEQETFRVYRICWQLKGDNRDSGR